MAITSFRELFTTFGILGIFIFSAISFVVVMQTDNNVNNTILENEVINNTFTRLDTNLTALGGDAQTQKDNYDSEIPERGFGSLLIFSIVSVSQQFTSGIISIWNIMVVLPASILGIPTQVVSVFNAILIVSLVLLGWRVIRLGS